MSQLQRVSDRVETRKVRPAETARVHDLFPLHAEESLCDYQMPKSWQRPALIRLRWQLPLMLSLSAIAPVVLFLGPELHLEHVSQGSLLNTIIISSFCSVLSVFLFRRLEKFPGISSFGHIAPSAAIAYGVGGFLILALRVDYSRPLLLASATVCLAILAVLWLYYRRHSAATVYVLPGAQLTASRRLKLHMLSSPTEQISKHSLVAADLDQDLDPRWQRFLLRSALAGIPVFNAKALEESTTGRVAVRHLSENTFGSVIPNLRYQGVKRAIDLVTALAALPMLLPIFAFIALAIRLESRGSVFFKQERVGFCGRTFVMYKFRSMLEAGDKLQQVTCAEFAKTKCDDDRITRCGRFLRRHRLDELPQVLNIIRGDMSWIGPRPEARPLSRMYARSIPFYGYRHIVRPGLTGWAQVNQGHVVDVDAVEGKLQYDFYYIKYFSGWLDALIVARTVRVLLLGVGAK